MLATLGVRRTESERQREETLAGSTKKRLFGRKEGRVWWRNARNGKMNKRKGGKERTKRGRERRE